jgi:O-antigen ligase
MTSDERWTAIFDRIALFLTLLGFLLREWVPGSTAGAGLNLFIHLLFWIALTLWFAGRATGGGADYRFTGFEFAFLAFAVVALLSVLRASYKLAALDQALTWLSFALFFVLCVQVVGRRLLISILLATAFALSLYALIQYFVLFPLLQPAAASTDSIEMSRRIRTNEPFATFIGPNQLAGFLALLLPLLAGSMVDAKDYKLRGPLLFLGLVALALTGSLGGWVALACGIATIGGLHFTRHQHRKLIVGVGAGAVAVAVALLLWSPLLSAVAARSHSMHVRAAYWRATGPIIGSAPLLGVGLDNWQEHYFRTKPDVQQETKKAHNDYLQVLSETGIVGLLALAGILVLGLRKALTATSAPDPDPAPPSRGFVAILVGSLVLFGILQATDIIGHSLVIVLAAAWTGALFLLGRAPEPADSTWTRIGLAGGLVGFMVHMVVDFQIYEAARRHRRGPHPERGLRRRDRRAAAGQRPAAALGRAAGDGGRQRDRGGARGALEPRVRHGAEPDEADLRLDPRRGIRAGPQSVQPRGLPAVRAGEVPRVGPAAAGGRPREPDARGVRGHGAAGARERDPPASALVAAPLREVPGPPHLPPLLPESGKERGARVRESLRAPADGDRPPAPRLRAVSDLLPQRLPAGPAAGDGPRSGVHGAL